jgi:uncharacterized membrane protein YccC
MASPSVSFRISRSAEDLAETIHTLSQRLVTLEQRLQAMELGLARQEAEPDPEELASLGNVERLLRDCRDLLGTPDGLESEAHLQETERSETHAGMGPGEGFAAAA